VIQFHRDLLMGSIPGHRALIEEDSRRWPAPADISVEQPTSYTLAINLKTAKVLGIMFQLPCSRADEVIE
jgi:hypothetical protein